MTAEVSHGRGGAGNINPDDTQYVDGEVVRTGPEGSQGHGAYSAGRGGTSDIRFLISVTPSPLRHRRDELTKPTLTPPPL